MKNMMGRNFSLAQSVAKMPSNAFYHLISDVILDIVLKG
jgi:hypothetical protein